MILCFILLGIMCEGVVCYIGNGVVLFFEVLFKEIGEFEEVGVNVCDCLFIFEVMMLILLYYIVIDQVCEVCKGVGKIGMMGCGIGFVYEDKVGCCVLCVQDLFDVKIFVDCLCENFDYYNFVLIQYLGGVVVDFQVMFDMMFGYVDCLKLMVVDVLCCLYDVNNVGQNLLFEGV